MKTEPGIRSETTPSIRHDVTPFGYAIVDKNGEKKSCLIWFREELAELNECIEERDKMCPGGAPHRIVELYTKEQLEKELEILRSKAFASGREILRLREKFEAVHGIVQPNSLEPAKGDL